ncbi:MAG: prolyl oligopeptidase family serine peptidase, partial [Pseudomonadota bacterium]
LIAGSSAGGYTVLAALAFRNLFKAGCSSYGIGDLLGLQAHTHKFESRYLETLLAPLPQGEAMYLARSPVHNPAGFACPMLFLQGLDDIIVPPAQTRAMAKVLDDKKIPHACLYFAGEGHGFRKPHHIEAALQAQLWFYGAVFGFRPAGDPFNLDIRHGEVLARSQ